MKPRNNVILLFAPVLILVAVVALNNPEFDLRDRIQYILITSLSYVLAIVSYFLYRGEPHRGTGVVFLNFMILFGLNSIPFIAFDLISWCFPIRSREATAFFSQYSDLLYFFLLSTSVTYLVIDALWKSRKIYEKYLVVFLVVGGMWGYQSYPYLIDPRCLLKKPEVLDYLAVRDAMAKLRTEGNPNPSTREIAAVADLKRLLPKVNGDDVPWTDKEKRVSGALPYLKGENFGTLYWRPLYEACSWMGMFCTLMVVISIVFQYSKDPPTEAYLEKIVWCLLFYCSFEGLHFFAFSKTSQWETLDAVVHYGGAFSVVAMSVLLFLFSIRLKFIRSVEGRYYERRLIDGADSITRWRDAFDNWVLRQFMDPKELDRRFVIRRNTESDLQD